MVNPEFHERLEAMGEMPEDSFARKTVVVRGVGGEGSPGFALAQGFARHGARIVAIGFGKSKLKAASNALQELGAEVMTLHRNRGEIAGVDADVDAILNRFGSIDVLVNGVLLGKPDLLKDVKPNELERTLEACLVEPYAWMRACLPYLSIAHGSILSLGSQFVDEAASGVGALATALQGFATLNRFAAEEWSELGVSTNIVQSSVHSENFKCCAEEFDDERLDPRGPMLSDMVSQLRKSHDRLVEACLYLASDEGHDITGCVLRV